MVTTINNKHIVLLTKPVARAKREGNDDVSLLPISASIASRLRSNGYGSIRQLKGVIEYNQEEKVTQIPGIGRVKFELIKDAVLNYQFEIINPEVKEEKMEEDKRRTINKYEMAKEFIWFLRAKFNNQNVPKYPVQADGSYPHSEILYNDDIIFIQVKWLEDEFKEHINKNFKLITAGNVFEPESPLRMVVAHFRHQDDTPIIYKTEDDGKCYAFSAYPYIIGNRDKYLRISREKFEVYCNISLDLTLSDELSEEWARFDPVNAAQIAANQEWMEQKNLAEVWANQRKPESALRIIIDYCNDFKFNHDGFKDIHEDVTKEIEKYLTDSKDKELNKKANEVLEQIRNDKGIEQIVVRKDASSIMFNTQQREKTPESVLTKDLKKLPESIQKEIIEEILPPLETPKRLDINVCIVGCMRFGDTCNAMVQVIKRKSSDDKYTFSSESFNFGYQFNKDTPENGMMMLPEGIQDLEGDIKKKVIEEIKAL